jgi:hypothetical protein
MLSFLDQEPIRQRLARLVRETDPGAERDHLQGAFADEAEETLETLGRLAWRRPTGDTRTVRAEQMIDGCWERLDHLRDIPARAADGYVAYSARGLARELDMVFFLLNPDLSVAS